MKTAVLTAADGTFTSGTYIGTLANNGTGLVSVPRLARQGAGLAAERADEIKADIISGKITITSTEPADQPRASTTTCAAVGEGESARLSLALPWRVSREAVAGMRASRTGGRVKLELKGITKRFGSLVANDRIDLSVEPRARSTPCSARTAPARRTLMNVLYGLLPARRGRDPASTTGR